MGDHLPAQYRPNESSQVILSEHTWLQGAFLAAIAYGIQFVLYIMSSYLLYVHRTGIHRKKNLFLIFYISIIFILSTLYMAGLLEFTQESFIDGRNIQGGPNAFEQVMFSLPIDMLANVIMVLNSWFCDVINVWRCLVIYQGGRVPALAVSAVPMLLYLASVVFGILFLKQVGTVTQSPWDSSGINFTIPYYTMSLALNIIVTLLIVLRLLVCRHRITQALGPGHGSHYTSLVAMIVESAAIYSTFALMFLVPFAVNSPIAQLFLQALSPIQGVTTFLIIFRIAQGKGWSSDAYNSALTSVSPAVHTIGGTTRIRFRSVKTSTAQSSLSQVHQDGIVLKEMGQSSGSVNTERIAISKTVHVEESV